MSSVAGLGENVRAGCAPTPARSQGEVSPQKPAKLVNGGSFAEAACALPTCRTEKQVGEVLQRFKGAGAVSPVPVLYRDAQVFTWEVLHGTVINFPSCDFSERGQYACKHGLREKEGRKERKGKERKGKERKGKEGWKDGRTEGRRRTEKDGEGRRRKEKDFCGLWLLRLLASKSFGFGDLSVNKQKQSQKKGSHDGDWLWQVAVPFGGVALQGWFEGFAYLKVEMHCCGRKESQAMTRVVAAYLVT